MRISLIGAACVVALLIGKQAHCAGPVHEHVHLEPIEEAYYADMYADHYGVPRALVHAFIDDESNWHPDAVSSKGAMGLMQLMPATARTYGVRDPFSVTDNLSGGTQFLADLIRQFGDFRLVAAAYYAGAHRVSKRGLDLKNPEVVAYVKRIRRYYDEELIWHQNPVQFESIAATR
jgi:soluble lytic murein transglycosylase-like protein